MCKIVKTCENNVKSCEKHVPPQNVQTCVKHVTKCENNVKTFEKNVPPQYVNNMWNISKTCENMCSAAIFEKHV
jgi:hypothetical protein